MAAQAGKKDAAVWFRVSTAEQEAGNQAADIEQFTVHHGYTVTATYTVDDSAWHDGTGGAEYQAQLAAALQDAWQGKFSVIIVWALDRITRKGAEDALRLIRQFRERGVTLVSVHEDWLNGSPEVTDILVAFAGWMAEQESRRRSERIRAGIARRRADVEAGKIDDHVGGRKPGSRDKRKRRTDGYRARWERERADSSFPLPGTVRAMRGPS